MLPWQPIHSEKRLTPQNSNTFQSNWILLNRFVVCHVSISGKFGDVCTNTSWEISGGTQIFTKNPYLQEIQFKGKNIWKYGSKLAFNIKTQYVGKNILKQICPKLFPGLLSLLLLFAFIARFYFPKSPSCTCHTISTHPEILIALFSLSAGNSVFLVLILYSLLCLFNSLWIPSPGFHFSIITNRLWVTYWMAC